MFYSSNWGQKKKNVSRFEKDQIRASRCSGRKFPPAPSTRKRPVREAKFNLKNYTGWNANSYINNILSFSLVGLSTIQIKSSGA